jgi:energy-coupling factor transporter ATP-binding protein EcfA2
LKILDLQTFGVRGVPDGFYDFAVPADVASRTGASDLVVVTGPSGSGKTRFLELIVAVREALTPKDEELDHDSWICPGHRTAKAQVSWLLSPQEQRAVGAPNPVHRTETIFGGDNPVSSADELLIHLFKRYDHTDATSKVEYFAEDRRLDVSFAEMSTDPGTQVRYRTSKSPRKYAFVPAYVRELRTQPAKAERFASTLTQLSRTCHYDVERSTLVSQGRPVRALLELSGSERDALLLAATASNVGLSQSIVLVDRPELMGASPRDIVPGLVALGAQNQLFVATARPELTVGARHVTIHLSAEGAAP